MSEDNQQDPKKELKKLMESHLAVLEHKLGHAPSMQEMLAFLSETNDAPKAAPDAAPSQDQDGQPQADAADPSTGEAELGEPKILGCKAYYGMTKGQDGSRTSDPRKVLFYEMPAGDVYDCNTQEWCPERPQVLDHLNSRGLEYDENGHDIMAAIVNGVLDEDDYSALDKCDMLNDHHRKVWELNKRLQENLAGLQKSETFVEESVESDLPDEAPSEGYYGPSEGSVNVLQDFQGVTGSGPQEVYESEGEEGQDVFSEIVRAALGDIDQRIKDIVRQEFGQYMDQFLRAAEQEQGGSLDLTSEPRTPE
jgi:hypothetical protein